MGFVNARAGHILVMDRMEYLVLEARDLGLGLEKCVVWGVNGISF